MLNPDATAEKENYTRKFNGSKFSYQVIFKLVPYWLLWTSDSPHVFTTVRDNAIMVMVSIDV